MFRLLGFDVHVRTGFLIFLGLIVFLYQDTFGIWLAGGIAVFTLLHELGHAVAARSAGAHAEISLDFLAGYTSFRPDPRRPMSRLQRAVISASGPFTQIGVSCVVLAAMGVNPVSIDSVRAGSEAAAAIWWAGPAIGVLNLIPVLPLDGGHLATTAIEPIVGDRAMRVMAIASLAVTAAGAAWLFSTGNGGFGIFVAFLLLSQFQIVQATSPNRRRQAQPVQRFTEAEASAWQTGRPGMLEPGQRLSPWYEAHRAVVAGEPDRAADVIVSDLRSTRPPKWAAPSAASGEQLRAIVATLPHELPAGNPYSARILAEVLLATGDARRAAEYAAAGFAEHETSDLATMVARASAAAGDPQNALGWLRAAADAVADEPEPYAELLAHTMDRAHEFGAVREDPSFHAVRSRLP